MGRHSYIRQTKLFNVNGKIDYISNPNRQEHLYAVYETNPMPFWKELARYNQQEFRRIGTSGKCIEARELVIALPENYLYYDMNQILKRFTEKFKEWYGVECSSALHHNARQSNLHIHLIFSERKVLSEPEIKIATRNMFYDERGKRVRTKKEILDSKGKIRNGCHIILKGMEYGGHEFQSKEPIFKTKNFNREVKIRFTELINEWVPKNEEKLTVFSKDSAYLPMKKIGKNNPMAYEIERDNRERARWNATVDQALQVGIPEDNLRRMKRSELIEPIKKSVKKNGNNPRTFRTIVAKASKVVTRVVREWMKLPEERKKEVVANSFKKLLDWCRERVEKANSRSNKER